METRDDQESRPQAEHELPKSRLERWIERLEERIAPCDPHINPQGKYVGSCHHRYRY
jgi:hypothetical protein